MAFIKTKDFKGISANYWKMTEPFFDVFGNFTRLRFALFLNGTVNTKNIANVLGYSDYYIIPGVDWSRNDLYTKVKALPPSVEFGEEIPNFFADAVDAL